jgi:uncharacterized protein YxeA
MKKTILTILTLIILNTGTPFVFAQEYTAYDGPSDIEEEVENEGEYIYVEERDELDPGLFENIIEAEENEIEKEYQVPGYLNYKSWQFWFLIIILLLIIFILIRLFKKLSKINTEIKRHENYLKEVKVKKRPQVSEKDEILYSEPSDDE